MFPSPLHIMRLFILHLNVCILQIVVVYSIIAISHNLCHLNMVAKWPNNQIRRDRERRFKKPLLLSNDVISIMLGEDDASLL